jgi:hypothetical protein
VLDRWSAIVPFRRLDAVGWFKPIGAAAGQGKPDAEDWRSCNGMWWMAFHASCLLAPFPCMPMGDSPAPSSRHLATFGCNCHQAKKMGATSVS